MTDFNFTQETFAAYIQQKGGTLFVVGGAVRDMALGMTPKDLDFMVVGLNENHMADFKRVGAFFPVYLINIDGVECEVALARREKKEGTGYNGFSTETENVSLEEDLSRRDFTFNAMALNVLTNEIIDPFGGIDDLRSKVIRHVGPAFAEDPTRILRAARFAATFGFEVSPATLALMSSMKEELKTVSKERVFKELQKALKTEKPSVFFNVLSAAGVLEVWFPEVEALKVEDKHDDTAYQHTMTVMDHGRTPLEKFMLLCHDLGKGLTPKEDHPKHYNHDILGLVAVEALCQRIGATSEYTDMGKRACRTHMTIKNVMFMRHVKVLRLIMMNKDVIHQLIDVSFIDSAFREGGDVEEETEKFNQIRNRINSTMEVIKEVNGGVLIAQGCNPKEGKKFGERLESVRIREMVKRNI